MILYYHLFMGSSMSCELSNCEPEKAVGVCCGSERPRPRTPRQHVPRLAALANA